MPRHGKISSIKKEKQVEKLKEHEIKLKKFFLGFCGFILYEPCTQRVSCWVATVSLVITKFNNWCSRERLGKHVYKK